MLQPPTPKQREVLQLWAQRLPLHTSDAMNECILHYSLQIPRQAGVTRLASLVHSGWATAQGPAGEIEWYLTEAGRESLGYYVQAPKLAKQILAA